MASAKSTPGRALVLFDIDGTLIRRAGPHHREALIEGVRRVAGVETSTDHIPVQGMLDRDILTLMLAAAGVSRARARVMMAGIMDEAQRVYVKRCPDLRKRVCPGVRRLLWRLDRRGAVMGLVTGNLTRIAWTKMERADLRGYFRLGAFADMGTTRAALAKLAIRQARREGLISRDAPIALVGDHQNDIQAAKANGIRSVSVASGLSSMTELAECEPDVLAPDMRRLSPRLVVGPGLAW